MKAPIPPGPHSYFDLGDLADGASEHGDGAGAKRTVQAVRASRFSLTSLFLPQAWHW
jgi:hypothetical protein